LAWFHTVNGVAARTTATAAPPRRKASLSEKYARIRWTTRNQKAAAPAPITAEKRFTLTAVESPVGASSSSQAREKTTKSGFPGGWGMPMMWVVAMYSLASQNAVVGARVTAYSAKTATPASAAPR
jgi:hypothetical protein